MAAVMGLALSAVGGRYATRNAGPDRNVRGNPLYETLVQRCVLPGTPITIRLYHGSADATVAFWYSLTRERPGARELQFWFSYDTPAVDAIACRPEGLAVLTADGAGTTRETLLSATEIERELVPRPLVYHRGELSRISRDSLDAAGPRVFARMDRSLGIAALAMGIPLLGIGGIGLARRRL